MKTLAKKCNIFTTGCLILKSRFENFIFVYYICILVRHHEKWQSFKTLVKFIKLPTTKTVIFELLYLLYSWNTSACMVRYKCHKMLRFMMNFLLICMTSRIITPYSDILYEEILKYYMKRCSWYLSENWSSLEIVSSISTPFTFWFLLCWGYGIGGLLVLRMSNNSC